MIPGDSATLERRFTREDVSALVRLAGDPGTDGVPQPLIAALFSRLLGVDLPGPGTNYLKQEITWLGTAPLDTLLEARVTVTRLRPEKHLVDLETLCRVKGGPQICRGRALVYVGDVAAQPISPGT